jgi:hypothetical protein
VTLKSLFTGMAAAAAVGGAALGVTTIAAPTIASAAPGSYNIPLQPAPCDASVGQLRSVIDGLLAQGVPASGGKSDLVEGGIGFGEGRLADRAIKNAYASGSLPIAYDVSPPVCNGPTASSTLSAKGQTLNAVFVPGGRYGYVLSKSSAVNALSLFG